MIPYLQAENLSKRYGGLLLFEDISFTITKDRKVALIARNGAGKSSLFDLLAGKDTPDGGRITWTNDVRVGYLEQSPRLDPGHTVWEEIFTADSPKLRVVKEYELALVHHNQEELARLTEEMEHLGAWDAETEVKQILTRLKITDLEARVGDLSGGQKKRLGLAKVLISHPDFLLLDEPTNHLDLDMIEWLETYLERSSSTLLMVTHDRYFLDRVCDEILELENNEIFSYTGNYSYFLEKREERMEARQSGINKARNLLRTEIEWMRRMPQARSHKAKYRINAFSGLQEKARAASGEKTVNLHVGAARLGKKIMEIEHLSKGYGDLRLINDFSYTFSRFEKVGIVGDNGTGKTTFLNLITGLTTPDAGTISVGTTIRFGHYRQSGISFNPRDKVLDAVARISELIGFDDGSQATAQQMLTRFLFPPAVQHDYVEKLSGGEQRRLYLCTVLMQKPNFLLLDEPTNDLDILTLNVLEEYLREFEGCVIIVSHDRFFMDKIIDHLFVFEGNGKILDFPGNYTQYRNAVEEAAAGSSASGGKTPRYKAEGTEGGEDSSRGNSIGKRIDAGIAPEGPGENGVSPSGKVSPGQPARQARKEEGPKLTFREKREMENLETEIATLEARKKELETQLSAGTLGHEGLFETSLEIGRIGEELDEKELRWLELSEKKG